MARLPSGTVTFLFTDIEGSTRMWERAPGTMAGALARHDALLRACIDRHDGHVFKTVGDAFCAAFHTATDALAAACDAQRELAAEGWPEDATIRVRMALHTGAAEVRDDDYFGQPLNRVARLLSAGHGGQVLLSLATQELVRDSLPGGVALRDMGERRLKDLIRPERVFQVVDAGLPADFPPLKTLDARAHNLPVQPTSFVGRERELADVEALLRRSRLVTLTGSGGAGKSRLSLQVAANRIDEHEQGVWFVELAPLRDGALVPQAVAAVLGVAEVPGEPLLRTLVAACRERDMLVVLDNCEHLIDAAAELCGALLAGCARVAILASAREALRVPGETSYRVPALPAPPPDAAVPMRTLTQYAAVRLFIDRAQAVRPSFRVTDANAPAVASICHHLDGIPLAIELAAARLRAMTAEEVNRGLDRRFALLTGGARTALPRQQTLRALVDWSYALLEEDERVLFARLSVFAGGWTREAAEAVCAGEGIEPDRVLDLLAALVDKSIVVADERDGAMRYRMLETLRQYAGDRLREQRDEALRGARHVKWVRALAEEAEPNLRGGDQARWFDRLEAERDNLRTALAWAGADAESARDRLAIAGSVWWFWYVRGHLAEGRALIGETVGVAPEDAPIARAKALNGMGVLAQRQGDYRAARAHHEEALAIWRAHDDRAGMANALNNLGSDHYYAGDYASARACYEESLRLRRALGDRWGTAAALANLRNVASHQGDAAAVLALSEESLAIFRELGDRRAIAMALGNLGNARRDRGESAAACVLYEESVAILRELGDRQNLAFALDNLGSCAHDRGDLALARQLHEESLQIATDLGDRQGAGFALNALGDVALDSGTPDAAQGCYARSLAVRRSIGDRHGIAESLEGLAAVAAETARERVAATLWGAITRLRDELGAPLTERNRAHRERRVAAVRATIGEAAFEAEWREGAAMPQDALLDYAQRAAATP
jgi:predicted ATPase/class 3 adenylate cyclase